MNNPHEPPPIIIIITLLLILILILIVIHHHQSSLVFSTITITVAIMMICFLIAFAAFGCTEVLQKGRDNWNQPLWRQLKGASWLFSSPDGFWRFANNDLEPKMKGLAMVGGN